MTVMTQSAPPIEKMPYPVAHLYAEMRDEPDARLRFRNLIKVFIGGLKYVSLICIADYMKQPDSDAVNSALSVGLERPAAGHWLNFLRGIVKHYKKSGREFHVRELKGVMQGQNDQLLGHLVHLRNTYVHPDIFPGVKESAALIEQSLPLLHAVLWTFSFIAKYPLIRIAAGRETPAMGNDAGPPSEEACRFVVRAGDGTDLDVTAFMLIAADESFSDLLVYETLIGKSAKYIMGNHLKFVEIGDEPDNRVKLLFELLQKCATREQEEWRRESAHARTEIRAALHTPEFPLWRVKRLALGHSNALFEEYKAARRFDPQTYVPRKNIQAAYEALEREGTVLAITADSGAGKSTEVCHLFARRFHGDVVWIVSGRRVRGSVIGAITEHLIDPEDRTTTLRDVLDSFDMTRRGERFVILVDGLNEMEKPAEGLQEIVDLVDGTRYHWLKIVITCRSFAWSVLARSGIIIDRKRFVASDAGDIAHVLKPFDDDELQTALDRYSLAFDTHYPARWGDRHAYQERKLLRSPLILRFVFEAFRDKKEMPPVLDVEMIMRQFTAERLRGRDLPFLRRYLMAYFFREESDVLDTRRLIALQESGAEISQDERKLIEHICGEQVYDFDQIWTCGTRGCQQQDRPLFAPEGDDQPRCPSCFSALHVENVDNRSTYSRLLSENILSQTDCGDHVLVRLVFDRYFDHLMRRYCFVETMQERDDPPFIAELFQKSIRRGTFVGPLTGVLLSLWRAGNRQPAYRIAASDHFAAYHVLRTLFEALAAGDFAELDAALRTAAAESNFNVNVCRAGIHALLVDRELAERHAGEVVELVLLLSRCESEHVPEDAALYAIELKREGVDIITPLVERCADALTDAISIRQLLRAAHRAERERLKGIGTLFFNVALFGLGSFPDDAAIRGTLVRRGVEVAQRALHHPLLSLGQRPIARFVSRWLAKIYIRKGPLPCNYWEMAFQLSQDRERIRQMGDLFFVERRNLFDLSYDDFYAAIHSENGLITWYALSFLPAHYQAAADEQRALDHMSRMVREGTEMDRYVVGEAAMKLLRGGRHRHAALERLLDEIASAYERDASQIFLHPAADGAGEGARAASATRRRVEEIRKESDPFMLPWIVRSDGAVRRVYMNTVAYQLALLRLRRSASETVDDVLRLLDRNLRADLLRFGGDARAARRFVASFLIVHSLADAATEGFLRESFTTIQRIIETYVDRAADPENADVYRFAVVETLKAMKETHRDEVMAFVEQYETGEGPHAFLAAVKTAAVGKEKLLSKSLLGDNIYHAAFASRQMREAFGRITSRAAAAKNADQFFFIYTLEFMQWLRSHAA